MSKNENGQSSDATVKVLLFSVLQDAAGGQQQVEWPLTSGSMTVSELIRELYAHWPDLEKWDAQIRVAVDLEYVNRDHPVKAGQEVALMPPVQGG